RGLRIHLHFWIPRSDFIYAKLGVGSLLAEDLAKRFLSRLESPFFPAEASGEYGLESSLGNASELTSGNHWDRVPASTGGYGGNTIRATSGRKHGNQDLNEIAGLDTHNLLAGW